MKKQVVLLSSLLSLTLPAMAVAPKTETPSPEFKQTAAERDQHMAWFRDARFGMFIHWGLYSQLAGEWQGKRTGFAAEWIQEQFKIPASQYMPLAKNWSPTKYDPRAWVRQMKAAGIRYICITTKHHDGFCLWPTTLNNDWNIAVTPYGKDLLKPLADACREEGVKFCIYHSVMDWHHSDWTGLSFNDQRTGKPDKERFKKEYLYPQLKELFTNYGEIGMIWLDGTWDKAWTSEDGEELEAYLRKLQPSLVINNRSGYKPPQPKYDFHVENAYSYLLAGDYISPEGEIPPTGLPGIDWESCQTMQPPKNWGYNRLAKFRAFPELLHELVDISSKGGNLLLNVGPNADGELVPTTVERLNQFAAWMKVNGEAIHGTTASPFESLPFDGRCTQKPGKLYLHVFAWPKDGKLLVPVTNKVKRAFLLADPQADLAITRGRRGVELILPGAAADPVVTVVVVEIEGPVALAPTPINLALGKPVDVSSSWPGREQELNKSHISDGNPKTFWAAAEPARDAWVTVDLQNECEISEVMLSDAPYGRTQSFDLEAQVSGNWIKIAEGTAMGIRQHLTFTPVKARLFRLNIRKASDTPTLAEFQLF